MGTLEVEQLKRVCIDLLRRNPGAYSDYVAMGSIGEDGDISFSELDEAYERYIHQEDEEGAPTEDTDEEEQHSQPPPGPNPPPRGPQHPTPPDGVDVLIVARCQRISEKMLNLGETSDAYH